MAGGCVGSAEWGPGGRGWPQPRGGQPELTSPVYCCLQPTLPVLNLKRLEDGFISCAPTRTQVLCPPGEVPLWGWPWREGRVIRDRRLWKGAGLGTVSRRGAAHSTSRELHNFAALLHHIHTSRGKAEGQVPSESWCDRLVGFPCSPHPPRVLVTAGGGTGHLGGLSRHLGGWLKDCPSLQGATQCSVVWIRCTLSVQA